MTVPHNAAHCHGERQKQTQKSFFLLRLFFFSFLLLAKGKNNAQNR
jgi:hypothetical protein